MKALFMSIVFLTSSLSVASTTAIPCVTLALPNSSFMSAALDHLQKENGNLSLSVIHVSLETIDSRSADVTLSSLIDQKVVRVELTCQGSIITQSPPPVQFQCREFVDCMPSIRSVEERPHRLNYCGVEYADWARRNCAKQPIVAF